MSELKRDIFFLIHQFLDEEKFTETAHELEKETGLFFSWDYFQKSIKDGKWDEVVKYLSGFTKVEDNYESKNMFFQIGKQKYLEALDKGDRSAAVEILHSDLKFLDTSDEEELFKGLKLLVAMKNFREHPALSNYKDETTSRATLLQELSKLIVENPLLRDKLKFPNLGGSRLQALMNHSLNWQHRCCKNPVPAPIMETLLRDHICGQPNSGAPASAPSPVPLPVPIRMPVQAPVHAPLRLPVLLPAPAAVSALRPTFDGLSDASTSTSHQAVSRGPLGVAPSNIPVFEQLPTWSRPMGISEQASPSIRFNATEVQQMCSRESGEVRVVRPRLSRELDRSTIASSSNFSAPMNNTFNASSSGAGGMDTGVAERNAPVNDVVTVNGDSQTVRDTRQPVVAMAWKIIEINEPSRLRSLRLSDKCISVKVHRLVYTNKGTDVIALASNGVHKLWKWTQTESDMPAKASTSVAPEFWQPSDRTLMTNDLDEAIVEQAIPCFFISNNDSYLISASGGKISVFILKTFKSIFSFMAPPPATTSLACHPQDNNIIAIGMEDSSLQVHNLKYNKVIGKIDGHQKRVIGLAFSNILLVSCDADAQLCVWEIDGLEKKASKNLQLPDVYAPNPQAQTRIQFHQDQTHVMIAHETQISIFVASNLECVKQWVPKELYGAITDGTYSCDCKSIYACLENGSICVLTAPTLMLRCIINLASYFPSVDPSVRVYPLAIAAHPTEPSQFALGLNDGGVHVVEPLESEGEWGTEPPHDNRAGCCTTTVAAGQ